MKQKFLKDFGQHKEGDIVDFTHTTFVKLGICTLEKDAKENNLEKSPKENAKL